MKGIIASLLCIALLSVAVLPGAEAAGAGWSAEERLSSPYPSTANDIEVAVNSEGSAIAAWNMWDRDLFRSDAWVALYDQQKGWTSATMLDSGTVGSSIMKVRMNDDGMAVAAWVRDSGSNEYPVVAIYEPGSGWEQPVQLSNVMADRIYSFDVALNPNGEIAAAWDNEVGSVYDILVSVYSPASGWVQTEHLISSPNLQSDVMVGISDPGDALVAWKERVELPGPVYQGNLWYSEYSALAGWSAPAKVNDDDIAQGSPTAHMDMDGQGKALLVYSRNSDLSNKDESYADYYDGGSWLPPVLLSADDDVESACPDVGLAEDGWGMVVWAQWDGGLKQYQYRTFENGAFGPIQIVPQDAVTSMNWPYLDVSEGRRAILTTDVKWEGEDIFHAYAVRYSPSTGWSAWERLDKNSLNDIYFLVRGGIDRNGNAAVAWISYDDGSNWNLSIWASAYTSGSVEVELQKEVNDLKGQLSLALVFAAIATIIAVGSVALLLRKGRAR